MSYSFWNSFIHNWTNGKKDLEKWSNPDSIPLFNDSNKKDLSSDYIPEPWWGNDGTTPIHSVVINFNPGLGNDIQKRGIIPFKSDYAKDIVNSGVLPKTASWHWKKRGLPVLSSLNSLGVIQKSQIIPSAHLSIELIPWHTKNVTKAYKQYVLSNGAAIFDTVLLFAAEQSKRIPEEKLRNTVLLKMNESSVKVLLESLVRAGYSYHILPTKNCPLGDGHCLIFTIDQLPEIRFCSIWGSKSRNSFPSAPQMDYILKAL